MYLAIPLIVAIVIIAVAQQTQAQNPILVTAVAEAPFVYTKSDGSAQGYLVDLLEELKSRLGFEYNLNIRKDSDYGVRQSDGSYSGLIGELEKGTAELGLAPLSLSSERNEAIDFSSPFMEVEIAMMTKRPEKGQKLEFGTVIDMVGTGRTYGTLKSGVIYDYLKNSKFTLYKEMFEIMENNFKDTAFPDSAEKAIEKIVADDFVYLEESPFAKYWEQTNCSVIVVRANIPISSYSLGFPKNSELRSKIEPGLIKMKEDGTLDRLYDKWWRSQQRCTPPKICMCPSDGGSENVLDANKLEFGIERDSFGHSSILTDETYTVMFHRDGFPFSYRTSYLSGSRGYSVDLVNAVAKGLGVKFRSNTDTAWGTPQEDGRFNGMIGALEQKVAVIAAAPFTIPNSASSGKSELFTAREKVVDFSAPIMKDVRIAMLTGRPVDSSSSGSGSNAKLPFETLAQLAEYASSSTGGSEIVVVGVRDSYVLDFLDKNSDPALAQLAAKIRNDNSYVSSIDEGVQLVQQNLNTNPDTNTIIGASQNKRYVLLEEGPFLSAYVAKECDLVTIDTEYILGDYAFALIKDSEFTRKVNYLLETYQRDGTLNALQRYHWFSVCPQYVTAMAAQRILLSFGK